MKLKVIILCFFYSCSTYRVEQDRGVLSNFIGFSSPVVIQLKMVVHGKRGDCLLDRNILHAEISRGLVESGHIVVTSNKTHSLYEVIVGTSCSQDKVHDLWLPNLMAYLVSLSLIPYITKKAIYTSVHIQRRGGGIKRAPATVSRKGFYVWQHLGILFPTPLFLGELGPSTNIVIAKKISHDILILLKQRGSL